MKGFERVSEKVSAMKRKLFLTLALPALAAILTACGGSASEGSAISDNLSIPPDSLSAQPLFIDREQDGTPMQLIALLDGEQVRPAYNTCQSCAGSPYAYFEYKDGLLTCRNCGNQFGLNSVGEVVGGCNPLPVGESSVEGDCVVIPASELEANASAFTNWRKFS